jgi:hypothetical protein
LHEIYGLSASGSGSDTTPATHTYPPNADIPPLAAGEDDETFQSECLLCLSSPREVVLLPCRHLVACKECALNMVEYGAGGNITYGADSGVNPTEEVTGGVAGSGGEGNASGGGSAPATAATPPTAAVANARRRRKAKGWFCPVCRERELFYSFFICAFIDVSGSAYTSMLRLTTTPPSPIVLHDKGDGDGSGSEEEGEVEAPRHGPSDNNANNSNNGSQGGGFGFLNGDAGGTGFFRSGFLRTFSGRGRDTPADVENQNQNPSSGA